MTISENNMGEQVNGGLFCACQQAPRRSSAQH